MKIASIVRKSKFIKDFLSVFSSNITLLLLGILGSMISSRVLGPSGMGTYAMLTNFSLLFVSLAELGIRQSTMFYVGKGTYNLNTLLSANINIWLFSSIVGIIIYFILFHIKSVDIEPSLIYFSALIIPATIANSFIGGIMLGADKFTKSAGYNLFNGVFKLFLIIIFVFSLNWGVLGAILALLLPTITLTFRKFFFLKRNNDLKIEFNFDFELTKKLISHGILFGLALFLMTNQKNIPIFVMAGHIDEYDIGLYNAGLTFSSLLYNVYNALAPIIFVKSAKASDPKENSLKIQKLMRVMFVILIVLSVILFFAIEIIIPLLYGNRFVGSIPVTRILFIGIIFYNVFLVLNMDVAGRGKPWIAIYTLLPVTVINYLSNFYFINDFGIKGAAFCTSLSMSLAAIIFLFFYTKEIGTSIKEVITPRKSDWNFIGKILKGRNPKSAKL